MMGITRMAVWRKWSDGEGASAVRGTGDGKVPRGRYVPMRLVGDGEGFERVLVPLTMLRELRMAELLEMAEQRYGYGQQGVLRIPCDARRFEQMMSVACKAR